MSTPILPFAVWQAGTNQNSIPANDNSLRNQILNGLVLGVANDAPVGSADGDIYIVGPTPAGAFASFSTDDLAIRSGGAWYAFAPAEGITVNLAGQFVSWDGSDYVPNGGLSDAPSDGSLYGRKDGAWAAVAVGGGSDVIDVNAPANVSGTVTLDFAGKSRYVGAITLGANVTTLAFDNLPGAGKYAEYELHIKQDATGGRTFAIPGSHKALGGSDTAIASAANAVTVLTASTADNGATWRYAMQESA